ncbi:MAG: ABC transporter permease [Phycisphaerales bacterium]|jgi:ABC-type transport system involved in multi-copper enzyme maturation permease subunit
MSAGLPEGTYWRQTWAIVVAAYRELNARKLFWLSLVLSCIIVAAIAGLGLDEEGITVFGWTFESPFFNASVVPPATFYKLLFTNLGVEWWLGLGSTVLALVSTAGIIPDLVSGGAIDMMLSRPIGRGRLFLTKWMTGLLFTSLQVLVFTGACFLVIGLRGGSWEPSLFLAVPLVVLFYSYLFVFCALVGLLTRSTVASLLLTMVFWFLVFGVQSGEALTNWGRTASAMEIASYETEILRREAEDPKDPYLEDLLEERDAQAADDANWRLAHGIFMGVMAPLPKTGETLDLLERLLVDRSGIQVAERERRGEGVFGSNRVRNREVRSAIDDQAVQRSLWWTIGTSLVFEGVMLAACVWIFRRRDF